jgi:hypothetical protein
MVNNLQIWIKINYFGIQYMMNGENLHYYETLNYWGSAGIFDHVKDDALLTDLLEWLGKSDTVFHTNI